MSAVVPSTHVALAPATTTSRVRGRTRATTRGRRSLDLALLGAATAVVTWLPSLSLLAALATALAWVAACGLVRRSPDPWEVGRVPDLVRILGCSGLLVLGMASFAFFTASPLPRASTLVAPALLGTATTVSAVLFRQHCLRRRVRGQDVRRVVVCGRDARVRALLAGLTRRPVPGYVLAGCVATDEMPAEAPGSHDVLLQEIARSQPDLVLLVDNLDGIDDVRRLVWQLEEHGSDVVLAPGLRGVARGRIDVASSAGTWMLHVRPGRGALSLGRAKRTFDLVGASLLLLLLAPVLVILWSAVRLQDGGPALFAQERIGRDGRPFRCLKFRSMVVDAESYLPALRDEHLTSVLFKLPTDPRVTRVGRWLRKYSLDELPQLWNVVRGDMSLVGPRPGLPVEVEEYDDVAHRRLRVRPGMTGLWQVSGRSDLSFDEAIELDCHYVDNWSLALDLQILLRTVGAVLFPRGAY